MIVFLLPLVAIFSQCHAKINANEPLGVAITPKIWNLLTTKANFISNVVTSIKFPDFDGKTNSFPCSHAKINANHPLAVAITPKIWNLLTTKANFITNAVTSIKFPDFDGKDLLALTRARFHIFARANLNVGGDELTAKGGTTPLNFASS
ncbi:hypothetical protein Y032_0017g3441 [Ancylostoma ceylanicum]|nr:hypothetical protein Y032_0017g3441 [Ancylostoma ceylanicum]